MEKVRWGVLSTAKIGLEKVIPAMQKGRHCIVTAIASRNADAAQGAAAKLRIPRAYGSYEALLADAEVEAVYIPLPNHMHVPWSIKSLEAGKHVLCEKPIGLNVAEAERLLAAAGKYPRLKIMEAFMYRQHPQWRLAQRLVRQGEIGELRTIHSFFSYHNANPTNIRNIAEIGGGGLMDIGCYCISLARFMFDAEPRRVSGTVEFDPAFKTDWLASGMMEFTASDGSCRGTATFTCSTQLSPYQRVNIFGAQGRIEIEIPFNAPPDRPCKLWHQRGSEIREHVLDVCDQYTIQGDLFSEAVLNNTPAPTPLADAVGNMRVIEAILQAARSNRQIAL